MWNYRILAQDYKGELWFGIHEVFYTDGIPDMCTEDAVGVVGDNLAEISDTLRWMKKALKKPILSYSDFEPGGKYYTDAKDSLPHGERYE